MEVDHIPPHAGGCPKGYTIQDFDLLEQELALQVHLRRRARHVAEARLAETKVPRPLFHKKFVQPPRRQGPQESSRVTDRSGFPSGIATMSHPSHPQRSIFALPQMSSLTSFKTTAFKRTAQCVSENASRLRAPPRPTIHVQPSREESDSEAHFTVSGTRLLSRAQSGAPLPAHIDVRPPPRVRLAEPTIHVSDSNNNHTPDPRMRIEAVLSAESPSSSPRSTIPDPHHVFDQTSPLSSPQTSPIPLKKRKVVPNACLAPNSRIAPKSSTIHAATSLAQANKRLAKLEKSRDRYKALSKQLLYRMGEHVAAEKTNRELIDQQRELVELVRELDGLTENDGSATGRETCQVWKDIRELIGESEALRAADTEI